MPESLTSPDGKQSPSGSSDFKSEVSYQQVLEQDRLLEVGGYLRQARLEQGMSIMDAARASSLPPRWIQSMEAGDPYSLSEDISWCRSIDRYTEALGLTGLGSSLGFGRRASAR